MFPLLLLACAGPAAPPPPPAFDVAGYVARLCDGPPADPTVGIDLPIVTLAPEPIGEVWIVEVRTDGWSVRGRAIEPADTLALPEPPLFAIAADVPASAVAGRLPDGARIVARSATPRSPPAPPDPTLAGEIDTALAEPDPERRAEAVTATLEVVEGCTPMRGVIGIISEQPLALRHEALCGAEPIDVAAALAACPDLRPEAPLTVLQRMLGVGGRLATLPFPALLPDDARPWADVVASGPPGG